MANKSIAETMTVAMSVRMGYSDLDTIRQELNDWWTRMGPRRGPDNTDRNHHVYNITQDLERIVLPDLTDVSDDVLKRGVVLYCALRARAVRPGKIMHSQNCGHQQRSSKRRDFLDLPTRFDVMLRRQVLCITFLVPTTDRKSLKSALRQRCNVPVAIYADVCKLTRLSL